MITILTYKERVNVKRCVVLYVILNFLTSIIYIWNTYKIDELINIQINKEFKNQNC